VTVPNEQDGKTEDSTESDAQETKIRWERVEHVLEGLQSYDKWKNATHITGPGNLEIHDVLPANQSGQFGLISFLKHKPTEKIYVLKVVPIKDDYSAFCLRNEIYVHNMVS